MGLWTRLWGTETEQERLSDSPANTKSLDLTILTLSTGGAVRGEGWLYILYNVNRQLANT